MSTISARVPENLEADSANCELVFDATSLNYLAKAERLAVVETLDGPRVFPEAVHHEVVTTGVEQSTTTRGGSTAPSKTASSTSSQSTPRISRSRRDSRGIRDGATPTWRS